ncbi:MAG: fumarylacetoacetate hydrolase family protein [Candidatus Omnitrophota bacterium]
MKIAKFIYKRNVLWGKVENSFLIPLKEEPYKSIKLTAEKIPLKKCRLLAPADPSKIILTGLNYKDHAQELNMKIPQEPVIFLKPPTALTGPNTVIIYPKTVQRLDYEAELAIVIRKKAKNIKAKDAHKYILGYTCLNDITARDLQSKDIQWSRAKSFDTFCPLGPWLITKLSSLDLKIQLYLNGKLKQNSSTKSFIFSLEYLIAFISSIMTLLPGDIISTGTPPGVGKMRKGDIVEVKIQGIGCLKNHII